jgi:hypothetical protein
VVVMLAAYRYLEGFRFLYLWSFGNSYNISTDSKIRNSSLVSSTDSSMLINGIIKFLIPLARELPTYDD